MGQVLHGSATEPVLELDPSDGGGPSSEIAESSEPEGSSQVLRRQPGDVRQVEAAEFSGRHVPTGPREPWSTVLTIEDEAIVVAFRRCTLPPLGRPSRTPPSPALYYA